MSDNVVNLRLARKQKARRDAEAEAQQNRVKFGQTKAEKTLRKAEEARAQRQHEAGQLSEKADPSPSET